MLTNNDSQPDLETLTAQHPIGVFDSGLGGLTVLRELYRQLPQESILYFADTARLPYGNRSYNELVQFVRQIISWMVEQGVKMVIMACNTCSALALDTVRSEFNIPILGVILPGARGAIEMGKRIGVIATPATATSNAYRQAILEINNAVKVWQVSCPEFVPLIEQNRLNDPYVRQVAQGYLASLREKQIDTLIYGCTHYPYLAPILKDLLPPTVRFIDPAQYVVKAIEQELELMGLQHLGYANPTRFCVSGDAEEFAQRSRHWLGCTPTVESICLPTFEQPEMSLYGEESSSKLYKN